MVEAYDKMAVPELRDDAKRVLAKNFPDDPMGQKGKNTSKPWWKLW